MRHVAPFRYAGVGGVLVRRFKLDGCAASGRFLAREMTEAWRPYGSGLFRRPVFVPVPLHRDRRRERGFDQASWLAAAVAGRLDADVGEGVLRRRIPTLPQGDPRVTSRVANVEHAFCVVSPRQVVGRAVVLVDDVFTSGATARTCGTLLRRTGAIAVAVLTACRS